MIEYLKGFTEKFCNKTSGKYGSNRPVSIKGCDVENFYEKYLSY